MGKNTARLIAHYWDNIIFVLEGKRFLGMPFCTGIGFMQGYPASPMIFNIMVEAVVRPTLEVVCGPQEVWYGMGWAEGERNLIFYADDRRIGGTDHIWIQDALMVSVLMFRRVVLETNLEKKRLWCELPFTSGVSGVRRPTSLPATD